MDIAFRCPNCQTLLTLTPIPDLPPCTCPSCRTGISFAPSRAIARDNTVDLCPRCKESSFYTQRDFNQKLGLAIVVLCALVGLGFVWANRPFYFYLCLGAGVLIDLVLYAILPEITICYACKTTFRNMKKNPAHGPFDLHIADHYEGRSQG